jgi:hypothetical protein
MSAESKPLTLHDGGRHARRSPSVLTLPAMLRVIRRDAPLTYAMLAELVDRLYRRVTEESR